MLWESLYVVETKKIKSDLGRKYDQDPGGSCNSQFQTWTEEPIYAYGACWLSLPVFFFSPDRYAQGSPVLRETSGHSVTMS